MNKRKDHGVAAAEVFSVNLLDWLLFILNSFALSSLSLSLTLDLVLIHIKSIFRKSLAFTCVVILETSDVMRRITEVHRGKMKYRTLKHSRIEEHIDEIHFDKRIKLNKILKNLGMM